MKSRKQANEEEKPVASKAKTDTRLIGEIYEQAREIAELELNRLKAEIPAIREEAEALGTIRHIDHNMAYNQMLRYAVLHRIKTAKAYRKGGMTWEQFCEATGESARNVDRVLGDVRPLYDKFSDTLSEIAGISFNKIRYLGQSVSDKSAEISNGALVVDGIKIPLKPENKEEIEALIDNLKETHQKEKAELEKRADQEKKRLERESKAQIESLEVEKKALVKENTRLKVFDPEEKDRTWSIEQAKEINNACNTFCTLCQKFIVDERITDDRHLHAQAFKWLEEAALNLSDLRHQFIDMFYGNKDVY